MGKALTFVLGFWFLFCELEMGGRSSKGGVSLCDAGSELNAQSVVKYDANDICIAQRRKRTASLPQDHLLYRQQEL